MPKLTTFTTEQGFFELAIAAPSRAAALRAWRMKYDLFVQDLARQSRDRDVITATLAQPGRVLRRPLGSKGAFGLESELPGVKAVPRTAGKKPRQKQRVNGKKPHKR